MTSAATARPAAPRRDGVVVRGHDRGPARQPADLLRRLRRAPDADPVTHVERVPARAGRDRAVAGLGAGGAARGARRGAASPRPGGTRPRPPSLAYAGQHVVIATGTASGKSLAYQLPALATLLADPRATVLYLAPTKALAADQLRAVAALDLDGRTPGLLRRRHPARRAGLDPAALPVRADQPRHAAPRHPARARRAGPAFLRRLRVRGGRRVPHLPGRLRLARRPRAAPAAPAVRPATGAPTRRSFVLASATVGRPGGGGRPADRPAGDAVTEDASPRGGVTFALWEPPLLPPARPAGRHRRTPTCTQVRRSALRETADLLADAVAARGTHARLRPLPARRRGGRRDTPAASLDEAVPGLGDRVAAYRAGYLREERRELERALLHGDAARPGLDQRAGTRRRPGRPGRGADLRLPGHPGLAVAAGRPGRALRAGGARACWWPGTTRSTPTWCTTRRRCSAGRSRRPCSTRPTRTCSAPQLCLRRRRARRSPRPTWSSSATGRRRRVRRTWSRRARCGSRPTGWYWRHRERPEVDLRGTGGAPVCVVEAATGRLLGTVDAGSAHFQLHPGAVYLHQGVSYVVDDARPRRRVRAGARRGAGLVHPRPRRHLAVGGVGPLLRGRRAGRAVPRRGRRDQPGRRRTSGGGSPPARCIDTRPLDLPARELRTVAVWFTLSAAVADRGRRRAGRRAGRAARRRARRDRPAAAGRHLRPLGHRRAVHRAAPGHRARRRSSSTTGTRAGPASPSGRTGRPRPGWRATRDAIAECGCEARLPVLRPVPEVRQRQQPAGQAGRGPGAGRGAGEPDGGADRPARPSITIVGIRRNKSKVV